MNQGLYKILSNTPLTDNVYKMVLEGDTTSIKGSGQFINISIPNLFLRRPISICDYDDTTITIIYKVVGKGTKVMSQMSDDTIDCLVGLGNGYDTSLVKHKALVIGGGVGIPPLYHLTKQLISEGKEVEVILGFNTKEEIFLSDEFEQLGVKVNITTVDGSYGIQGFVTDAMHTDYDYFFTCGPLPMFKAVYNTAKTSGQFSFEERMGCGFGACMGCSMKTNSGNKRVCKDGPVFTKEDIIW